MKNKVLTYALGLLVAGVWGMIIYRIAGAASGGDDEVTTPVSYAKKAALEDYALPVDTVRLMLNYRDPFSDPKQEPVEIPVSKLVTHSVAKVPNNIGPIKPSINWNIIKYAGYIKNPNTKKLVAMMNINGKEVLLSEGESAEQVKLVQNLRDSVKVSYMGTTKFIKLNKP
jgi:hypothetical protein